MVKQNSSDENSQSQQYSQGHGSDLDITRASLRIESLQTYAIISSIIMGSSIGLFGIGMEADNNGLTDNGNVRTLWQNLLLTLFYYSSSLSVISSSISTVTFMLCALYFSTALGMGADESFAEFDKSTSQKRKHAFIAFIASIFSFMSSFVVMVFFHVSNRFSDKLVTITLENVLPFSLLFLTVWAFIEFRDIVRMATKQIFNPLIIKPDKISVRRAEMRLINHRHNIKYSYESLQESLQDSSEGEDLAQLTSNTEKSSTPDLSDSCVSIVLDRRSTASFSFGELNQNLQSKPEVESSDPHNPTCAEDCIARRILASSNLEKLTPASQVQNRNPPVLSESCNSIVIDVNTAITACGETTKNLRPTQEYNSFDLLNPKIVQNSIKEGTFASADLSELASNGQLKSRMEFHLKNSKQLPLDKIYPQSRSVSFSDNLSEASLKDLPEYDNDKGALKSETKTHESVIANFNEREKRYKYHTGLRNNQSQILLQEKQQFNTEQPMLIKSSKTKNKLLHNHLDVDNGTVQKQAIYYNNAVLDAYLTNQVHTHHDNKKYCNLGEILAKDNLLTKAHKEDEDEQFETCSCLENFP